MRITLLHPAHTAIGSRVPKENLPPLGLLMIGGPLIDAGHQVTLVNADLGPMSFSQTVQAVIDSAPQAVLIGHSGSSSVHPTVARLAPAIKALLPGVTILYGGVYPTYHWREVLTECPAIDLIVRGEGEEILTALMRAVQAGEWPDRKSVV